MYEKDLKCFMRSWKSDKTFLPLFLCPKLWWMLKGLECQLELFNDAVVKGVVENCKQSVVVVCDTLAEGHEVNY